MSKERDLALLCSDMSDHINHYGASNVWEQLLLDMDDAAKEHLVSYIKYRYDTGWIYKVGLEYTQEAYSD